MTKTDHDFVKLTIKRLGKATAGIATAAAAITALATPAQAATITTTYHHPFYDITQSAFVDANHLHPGDLLQSTNATTAQITSTHRFHATTTTYDLTINGLHTYYVQAGTSPVLVHNCDPLRDFANSQREVPGTKFASEYESPSGAKYYSTNRHGTMAQLSDMPELQEAIDAAGHHGGCSEVGCLIQAYDAEGPSAITGGTIRTVNVRNPMSSRAEDQGTPATACQRCQRLFNGLGIDGG